VNVIRRLDFALADLLLDARAGTSSASPTASSAFPTTSPTRRALDPLLGVLRDREL
jgi:hypothetical protein